MLISAVSLLFSHPYRLLIIFFFFASFSKTLLIKSLLIKLNLLCVTHYLTTQHHLLSNDAKCGSF